MVFSCYAMLSSDLQEAMQIFGDQQSARNVTTVDHVPDLAAAAERAEKVAAQVEIKVNEHFTRTRRRVREALRADGVADHIDKLVVQLLAS
jgi:predicted transcriptional regulator